MNILILGLNYAPEPVGIGPYTRGMAAALATAGHEVTVVCGKPYYPNWSVMPSYRGGGVQRSIEDGVRINRLPLYVPRVPSGRNRLLHHLTFATRAQSVMFAEAVRQRPDVVIGVAPSLVSTVVARGIAKLFKAKLWLHIQDFEVEAAFATGLLQESGIVATFARSFERWSLNADIISTISPQMCSKLSDFGIAPDRIVEFRNWADIERVKPLSQPSLYRTEWSIERPYVALYSGNIANKQGIEIVVQAARLLAHRKDLQFVICGNGPNRDRLMSSASDLDNVRFYDLQPVERLSEMLGLASVHLLPQIAGAADLVLPSKLTNILASGRPVVATAQVETGLEQEVRGCGLIVEPSDAVGFAGAIEQLIDNPVLRDQLGCAARKRAEDRWSRTSILAGFQRKLLALVNDHGQRFPSVFSR